MNKRKNTFSLLNRCSAVFMSLALLWLTVSAPFIMSGQQDENGYHWQADAEDSLPASEEDSVPPGSSQEEKASSGSAFSEEYLHDHHHTTAFFFIASLFHNLESDGTYIAFHGELLVPPPNAV
jgi:hypothetical protein